MMNKLIIKPQLDIVTPPLKQTYGKVYFISLLVFFLLIMESARATEISPFNMPGKLIDIGTHKLHINCQGHGGPAVIIDSGLGGFSLEWKNIQDSFARQSMICSYDRAGYGWSEKGPLPRTTKQISSELNLLLERAEIPEPYILVGHSFGGYNMRYFASTYPEKVASLILVDASHPEQFKRLPKPKQEIELPKHEKAVTIRLAYPVIHDNYPEDVSSVAYRMLMSSKSLQTHWNELDYFEISAREVRAMDVVHENIPVIVLSRGKRVWPDTEHGNKLETTWDELQEELSYVSKLSVQLVAQKSGHSVHLDQPKLVGSVIAKTVDAAHKFEAKQTVMTDTRSTGSIESPINDYFNLPLADAYIAHVNYGTLNYNSNIAQTLATADP